MFRWLLQRFSGRNKPQRHRLERACLRITLLEGRAIPSASTYPLEPPRDVFLDVLSFRYESSYRDDRWDVSLDRRDGPEDDPADSPESVAAAGFLALSLSTAAIAPYDREEDAWEQPFHGSRV